MRRNYRWLLVLSGLASLVLTSGCNLLGAIYFAAIMLGMDTTTPPAFTFPEDARRVAVVTTADYTTQVHTAHLDHDLSEIVARKLFEGFDSDKKTRQIKIIKAGKVAKWQDEHPNWRSLDPVEIGRALEADYVIYLELSGVTYYEDGPSKQLYRGKADVAITVIRVDDEDGESFPLDELQFEFPKGRPLPAADFPLNRFRAEFLNRLSDQIIWKFIPHDEVYNPGADRF
jgi:hypothetical protein